MKILFIEPPKDIWFVMGEYLPPPFGIIQLAAYLEKKSEDVEIGVLDCNAEQFGWRKLEERIKSFKPDIVASSSLATCNAYSAARTLQIAKKISKDILTITGGQHFTALSQVSLESFPEIDVIVHGEGEETITDLVEYRQKDASFAEIEGISYRSNGRIVHTPPRRLINDLNDLPYPGYHFVKHLITKYHFAAMTGPNIPYALIEASRGCPNKCTFCSQWCYWQGFWRKKTAERVADEMHYCLEKFGSRFLWLTDDNFGFGKWAYALANEIIDLGIGEEIMWFTQARCDDVVRNKELLPRLRKAGLQWILLGVERSDQSTLNSFRKNTTTEEARAAVNLLKQNDIFTQAMFIIGDRKDTTESIADLREFANTLDSDFAIFAILTPFPGTDLYDVAKSNGWIEDKNWADYDMIHAVMPTETLSTKEIQKELYMCYRSFYGSWSRRFRGLFSRNALKRRIYRYMMGRGIVRSLGRL